MNDAFLKIFNIEPLTAKEFEAFSSLFRKISGINILQEKKGLIDSRLRKRFLALQMNPTQYLKYIETNTSELNEFIDALTTHKTDWMREPIHFNVLNEYVKKNKINKTTSSLSPPLNCWSAACSTGEEIYSIAMTLDQNFPHYKNWNLFGSDISQSCIEHCKQGLYEKSVVNKQLTSEIVKRYFLTNIDPKYKDVYKFTPEFNSKILFKEYNLVKPNMTAHKKYDVIFLRNVLIYFEKPVIKEIIKNLIIQLNTGGILILGLAEALSNPEQYQLKRLESSVYSK